MVMAFVPCLASHGVEVLHNCFDAFDCKQQKEE